MCNMVPFMLLVRMISSGVDFIFCATRAMTSPFFTMYSCFSGEGKGGEKYVDVDGTEQVFRFLEVLTVGIFLNKRRETSCVPPPFAFLP